MVRRQQSYLVSYLSTLDEVQLFTRERFSRSYVVGAAVNNTTSGTKMGAIYFVRKILFENFCSKNFCSKIFVPKSLFEKVCSNFFLQKFLLKISAVCFPIVPNSGYFLKLAQLI